MASSIMRSVSAAASRRLLSSARSKSYSAATAAATSLHKFSAQTPSSSSFFCHPSTDFSFLPAFNSRRAFSSGVNSLPPVSDPDIASGIKDLLAMSWDEIPDSIVSKTKQALSKTTEDKAGQKALANVFRAAEASVEFGGTLVSLRMALDDLGGLSGENVGHLPGYLEDAVRAAYKRYQTYLDSFGPNETYLRKKVETELGTKMIHLKMRCSGIGSEWGKITLIGTSGLSGSFVELRA